MCFKKGSTHKRLGSIPISLACIQHVESSGSCFVTFPSNLCQSDFPNTAVVYKAKDEKYNGQNKATDLKKKRKTQSIQGGKNSTQIYIQTTQIKNGTQLGLFRHPIHF